MELDVSFIKGVLNKFIELKPRKNYNKKKEVNQVLNIVF